VATATEIYDYLRLLYARVGRTYCPQCGQQVTHDTVDDVAARILALGAGTRIQAFFRCSRWSRSKAAEPAEGVKKPRGRAKKVCGARCEGTAERAALRAAQRGFNRLYQDARIVEFSAPESLLELDFARPVYILLDRIVVDADSRSRIVDAVESGYREAEEVLFETAPREGEPQRLRFSERFECKACNLRFEKPEPRLFSFNNPYGACPRCQGFGKHH